MPIAPVASCLTPRCPNPSVSRGVCAEHASHDRIYNKRWASYSKWFRSMFPLCGDAMLDAYESHASQCKSKPETERGCVIGWTLNAKNNRAPNGAVHHIRGHNGPDDPLFWDSRNHESLCSRCHNRL